ncbi:MAG: hypothetical protein ACI8V0_002098 [Pseudohongiellaceae bacterium]|jgi:hypothetical protein
MHELRRYRRLKIPLQVEIRHPAIGTLQVPAADMSDGGVFLLIDECFQLDLGESVIVRALGLGPHAEETGPALVMKVARKSHQGMGLSLDESASANLESLSAERRSKHTILQSLFIINDKNRVLFLNSQDSWRLPSRQLAGHESWPEGLQMLVDKLKSDSLLNNNSSIRIESSCYPNSCQISPFVNLLIPVYLKNSSKPDPNLSPDLLPKSELRYKWLSSAEISQLNTMLDQKLVDNILDQV